MKEKIKSFFEKENIEFYAVVPFSSLKVTNEGIMSRSGIAPQSAIIFLLPYYSGETENLSRYAASLDYHIIIKDVTERLIKLLSKEYPEKMHRGYGDHSPIDERGAAAISGLGIIGDNGLLINEKYGSYVFVAEVLSEIEADVLGKSEISAPKFCHHCGICKKMCPTEILSGKSNLCLSEITQRKGELSDFEIELMRKVNTVWGCDECQRACPHNANPIETPIEFFHEKRISKLTGEILANMSDEEFSERAFAWRKRKTVERNLSYFEK